MTVISITKEQKASRSPAPRLGLCRNPPSGCFHPRDLFPWVRKEIPSPFAWERDLHTLERFGTSGRTERWLGMDALTVHLHATETCNLNITVRLVCKQLHTRPLAHTSSQLSFSTTLLHWRRDAVCRRRVCPRELLNLLHELSWAVSLTGLPCCRACKGGSDGQSLRAGRLTSSPLGAL